MKKIDVIIPIYKAHDTIKFTLSSIGMQRVVDYQTYLIVDGEEQGSYEYLKEQFDIEIMYMSKNGGPGVARQYGLDNTQVPLISFIDADDTYISSISLYQQQLAFKQKTIAMVSTSFAEEYKDHTLKIKEKDMIWMHGKMYRRAFIDKYDIRFNETRANEDVGFNTQCQCYANKQEDIRLSRNITYLWQWRDDSIVRSNNQSYIYNESIKGYVINKIYAFTRVLDQRDINDDIKYLIITGLMALYEKHLVVKKQLPKKLYLMNKWSKKYYKELYLLVDKVYIQHYESNILKQTELNTVIKYDEYIKWKKALA
ncbi:hypothetical protein DRO61_11315 [Candidatus Bathyarchaeota archaeon]|nr:MAG: hypothetical protein DRO61_11315 [Candidatus Bathyarchaeota archaeon]